MDLRVHAILSNEMSAMSATGRAAAVVTPRPMRLDHHVIDSLTKTHIGSSAIDGEAGMLKPEGDGCIYLL